MSSFVPTQEPAPASLNCFMYYTCFLMTLGFCLMCNVLITNFVKLLLDNIQMCGPLCSYAQMLSVCWPRLSLSECDREVPQSLLCPYPAPPRPSSKTAVREGGTRPSSYLPLHVSDHPMSELSPLRLSQQYPLRLQVWVELSLFC